MTWCFADEAHPAYDEILDWLSDGQQAFVPSLWPLEVGNILLGAERRKRIAASASARFLAVLATLPIHIDENTAALATQGTLGLARQHGLSLYDATYLELAMRLGLPLASLDEALRKAASAVGLPVLPDSIPQP